MYQFEGGKAWIEPRPVACGIFSRGGGKVCSVKVSFRALKKKQAAQCTFEALFLGLFLFLAGQPGSDKLKPRAMDSASVCGGQGLVRTLHRGPVDWHFAFLGQWQRMGMGVGRRI